MCRLFGLSNGVETSGNGHFQRKVSGRCPEFIYPQLCRSSGDRNLLQSSKWTPFCLKMSSHVVCRVLQCESMFDDIYAMIDDYLSNEYTVDQMCIRAQMCTPPSSQ